MAWIIRQRGSPLTRRRLWELIGASKAYVLVIMRGYPIDPKGRLPIGGQRSFLQIVFREGQDGGQRIIGGGGYVSLISKLAIMMRQSSSPQIICGC